MLLIDKEIEIHKNTIYRAKKDIERLEKKREEAGYHSGQFFKDKNNRVFLIICPSTGMVCFIDMYDGGRIADSVKACESGFRFDDFYKMTGNKGKEYTQILRDEAFELLVLQAKKTQEEIRDIYA